MDPNTLLVMFMYELYDRKGLEWDKDIEKDVIAIINEMKDKIRGEVVHEVEKILIKIMGNQVNDQDTLTYCSFGKGFKSISTH